MKPTNKRTFLVFIVLFFSLLATAQKVGFEYDEAGNRILREVIYLKTTETDSSDQIIEYEEMLGETKVTISPNPNRGRFTVKIEGGKVETPTEIYLHTLNGSLIFKNMEAAVLTDIDISNRQNSTYILSLIINGKKEIWKVVKQ